MMKEEPLSTCSPQPPVFSNVTPRRYNILYLTRRTILFLVGPRGLLCPRGVHSVTLIIHLLSRLLATCPAHLCLLSLMLLIMSVTPLCFRIHSVLFLSFRVTPIYVSLHLPLRCDQFLKLGVAKRPDLTAIFHYREYTFVKCFPLQSHWHIFVSHDVVQFTECTPSLSDSPFHFLYLAMVLSHHLPKTYITVDLFDLLSIDYHIILVEMLVTYYFGLPQMHLKAYWLAYAMDILQHFL